MMPTPSRADLTLLGRWWWSVDRWTLIAVGSLIGFGYVMMLAASPAVAERIGASRDVFILKQVVFLSLAGMIVVAVSLLSPRGVRRLALAGCALALLLTAATLVIGPHIKGATRWIALPGISVQPSEFLKPCFAVTTAWLLSEGKRGTGFPGMLIAFCLFAVIAVLLKMQPDMGMLAVLSTVLLLQLFLVGLPLWLIGGLAGLMGAAGVVAYHTVEHFQRRVDGFFCFKSADLATKFDAATDVNATDCYQIGRSLEAFGHGGLLGTGPGEGFVKDKLPDAHADFVFAVMGEEFGFVLCLVLIGVFAFIVIRGLLRLLGEGDLFIILAATGLVGSFGLQAFVNMASTLHLIPTKGMTLPFVSYGGSSVMAVSLGVGMLLALTRRGQPAELL
jgi:cell division protein FtsW